MTNYKELVQEHLESSDHLAKKHVHPRLASMLEAGGMNVAFNRAQGQYLYDAAENQYLDLLAGGGVFFLGRNHPAVHQAVIDVLTMNVPNLVVTNASILGGLVAEKLLKLGGPNFSKVIFANSGAEATEVAIRFARYATRKRRFLALEGAFHGRTYGAISLCGFPQMKEGMDPIMPTVTPIRANDVAQLRRELSRNDVAGVFMEPVQGMTCEVLSIDYMREAEILCDEFGAILVADEVQTGLGRTGEWFATTGNGIRPGMITVSKTLSGGVAPVSAVMMREDVYERVFDKFTSGPIYFSTFAENNASMAASLATIETLEKLRAPQKAEKLAKKFRTGLAELQQKYDIIDRIQGKGLMMAIYFKESDKLGLKFQQKLLGVADAGAFGAAVNVDMFTRQRILVQLPGPAANAIKILPPVVVTDEDIEYFLAAFEDTLAGYYEAKGSPIASISRGVVNQAAKSISKLLPAGLIPPVFNKAVQPPEVSLIAQEHAASTTPKKKSRRDVKASSSSTTTAET